MSLLQKFTNLFKHKDELQENLTKLLKSSNLNDQTQILKQLNQYISKQPQMVFQFLKQSDITQDFKPKAENLLYLLILIHQNINNELVCEQMRQAPIYWIEQLMKENRESFILIERMITEQSTNSFFPQLQPQLNIQQTQNKEQKLEDKRKARIEMNNQLQNPIMNTEVVNNADSNNIKPKMFCIIYYSFLQKLSINLEVHQSSRKCIYPDNNENIAWLFKIQNIMQMGLKLLQCPQKIYKSFQNIIYQDLFYFQSFLKQELEIKIQNNIEDQIYEIYCEYIRAKQILENFDLRHEFKLNVDSKILDEFQRNAIKQKIKNQFIQNQKQQNVNILKQDKENQEINEQLNFQDFDTNHDYEREIVTKKYFNIGPSNQMSLDEITLQLKTSLK